MACGAAAARAQPRRASSEIGTALSAWLTGQLALASSAAAWKSSAEMPGTSPTTLITISVMPVPGTNVTLAVVSSVVGGVPACARPFDSAIE